MRNTKECRRQLLHTKELTSARLLIVDRIDPPAVHRAKKPLRGKDKIALAICRVIDKYKMAKHLSRTAELRTMTTSQPREPIGMGTPDAIEVETVSAVNGVVEQGVAESWGDRGPR
jgi:hypothetical protein